MFFARPSIQTIYGPLQLNRDVERFQRIDVKTSTSVGVSPLDDFISDIKSMASVYAALREVCSTDRRVRCHRETVESQNVRLNLQMTTIKGNIATS
jgi:hypothetical protein